MRRLLITVVMLAALPLSNIAQELRLQNVKDSVKFAVIGDSGTGDSHQAAIGKALATWRQKFAFPFIVMMGDNLYGGDGTSDYQKKFEIPYKALLDGGVKFYASLGNHDNPNERLYKAFNMNGERYYSFRPDNSKDVRFFAIDSNYIDQKQLEWLEKELAASGSEWKICFFHHPLYSSGETHGSAEAQRKLLEPIFLKYGVNVVLSGHEHFYERIKPQKGVAYFTLGNSAKLRKGDLQKTELTAKGFDSGYAFMLVEIVGDDFNFQVLTETGETIDTGSVHRVGKTPPTPGRSSQPVQQGPKPETKPSGTPQ
jgi:3',5'-cyclic AMP phosphodiesterase CpdA